MIHHFEPLIVPSKQAKKAQFQGTRIAWELSSFVKLPMLHRVVVVVPIWLKGRRKFEDSFVRPIQLQQRPPKSRGRISVPQPVATKGCSTGPCQRGFSTNDGSCSRTEPKTRTDGSNQWPGVTKMIKHVKFVKFSSVRQSRNAGPTFQKGRALVREDAWHSWNNNSNRLHVPGLVVIKSGKRIFRLVCFLSFLWKPVWPDDQVIQGQLCGKSVWGGKSTVSSV